MSSNLNKHNVELLLIVAELQKIVFFYCIRQIFWCLITKIYNFMYAVEFW